MTLYAKLKADGTLERYPYSLTDMRRDNPRTSFSRDIDDATAATFGVVPVQPSAPPEESPTDTVERGAVKQGGSWVEVWTSTPASAAQVAERTAAKSSDVRAERNRLLTESDWTQLADAPGGPGKASWVQYRQALRDIPSQPGFPWSVTWPVAPQS